MQAITRATIQRYPSSRYRPYRGGITGRSAAYNAMMRRKGAISTIRKNRFFQNYLKDFRYRYYKSHPLSIFRKKKTKFGLRYR